MFFGVNQKAEMKVRSAVAQVGPGVFSSLIMLEEKPEHLLLREQVGALLWVPRDGISCLSQRRGEPGDFTRGSGSERSAHYLLLENSPSLCRARGPTSHAHTRALSGGERVCHCWSSNNRRLWRAGVWACVAVKPAFPVKGGKRGLGPHGRGFLGHTRGREETLRSPAVSQGIPPRPLRACVRGRDPRGRAAPTVNQGEEGRWPRIALSPHTCSVRVLVLAQRSCGFSGEGSPLQSRSALCRKHKFTFTIKQLSGGMGRRMDMRGFYWNQSLMLPK